MHPGPVAVTDVQDEVVNEGGESEADSAVLGAKPDNAVMSVILIRELRL